MRYSVGDGSVTRARSLRREQSPPEARLWAALRGGRLGGHKFRRQQRLGPCFGDFVCQRHRLVVELDGDTHAFQAEPDQRRTCFLQQEGYRVIRFTNRDVLGNFDGVLQSIAIALAAPSPSHSAMPSGPLPLPHGERGQ